MDADALADVLNLSRGMAYKGVAGLDLGGGKTVIRGDPRTGKSEALLRAYGVFQGMRACAERLWANRAWPAAGSASRAWARSAAPGRASGAGGRPAAGHRRTSGGGRGDPGPLPAGRAGPGRTRAARRRPGGLLPCAMGGALDDATLAALQAPVVCGAANNRLAHGGIEKQLADRGVLYAPDYVVDAGGVIQVADELAGFDFERARARAADVFDTTRAIFATAGSDGVPPAVAADRIAERRMHDVAGCGRYW